MICMFMRLLRRWSPWLRAKEAELDRESRKVRVNIIQYQTANEELRDEIRSNNFAKYFEYAPKEIEAND